MLRRKTLFTYQDLIDYGHECNWLCKGRAIHSEVVYTQGPVRATVRDFMAYHYRHAIESGIEILGAKETTEAETWELRAKIRNVTWDTQEPDANAEVQAWIVTFRILSETEEAS